MQSFYAVHGRKQFEGLLTKAKHETKKRKFGETLQKKNRCKQGLN